MNDKGLANYHSHTVRCNHAVGTEMEYAEAAYAEGYRLLGFSDHAPWSYASGFVSRMRMSVEQLPDYVGAVDNVRREFDGRLEIHTGLECEYYPRYLDYIRSLKDRGIEYLLLGQHFLDSDEDSKYSGSRTVDDDNDLFYAERVAEAISTGLYTYVAHPDVYMRYLTSDDFGKGQMRAADIICQSAVETGTPLEFNLLGQLEGVGYPCGAFWEYCRKWPIQVIIGVDAHEPQHFHELANRQKAVDKLTSMGYTLIDRVALK